MKKALDMKERLNIGAASISGFKVFSTTPAPPHLFQFYIVLQLNFLNVFHVQIIYVQAVQYAVNAFNKTNRRQRMDEL